MTKITERKYILFDLDGTLSDSAPGIISSVCHALDRMGYNYENREDLRRFVGPPLREEFMAFCGVDDIEWGNNAVELYREYYRPKGIYENSAYDGIGEMLDTLKASGKILAVATSKPEKFARLIVDNYGFTEKFAFVGGSELDGSRTDKAEVIAYVMNELGAAPEECVMVGDRKHDLIGAKKLGVPSVGVLWGYGSKEELEAAGADVIVSSPGELSSLLK